MENQNINQKQTTLRQEAEQYVPKPITLNVAVLEKFPVDIDLKEDSGLDKDNESFTYKYIEIDEVKYRVPGSVIGGIKNIIKKMPQTKYVSVIKEGQGKLTKYQVMPYIDNPKEEQVQ